MHAKSHYHNSYKSATAEDTICWGAAFTQKLTQGCTIILEGELGSGKTTLTQGFARGLQIKQGIHSPSFTLIQYYIGERLHLCHIDLYRIDSEKDFHTLGVEEYSQENTVIVIEWGLKFWEQIADPKQIISIKITKDFHRVITKQ